MKLSEFYTSISSGRTDEEYFLSKNDFNVILNNLQNKPQLINSDNFMLSAGIYYNCLSTPISSLTFSFDESMNNSMCLFKTDSTITFDFTFQSGLFINDPINLDPNSIYLISMENNVIMWSEITETQTYSN